MKIVCKFAIFKETSGALRYRQTEQDGAAVGPKSDDSLIGSLYLRKAQMAGEPPDELTVTVEFDS